MNRKEYLKQFLYEAHRNHIVGEMKKTKFPKGINYLILKSPKQSLVGGPIYTYKFNTKSLEKNGYKYHFMVCET